MARFLIAFGIAIISSQAVAFSHGIAPPAVICDATTGLIEGSGGTCIAPGSVATCNGVANDGPAFIAFNAWAQSIQGSTPGQIALKLPKGSTCNLGNTVVCAGDAGCPFYGINNTRLIGNGGDASGRSTLNLNNLVTFSGLGAVQDNAHSARTASTKIGDTCVTLTTPSQASLFSVGAPVMETGFDLQGLYNAPFGFPPNPQFWDHLHVASSSTLTGKVCFTSPLHYAYSSNWPLYNSGDAFEVDAGGPATLYALFPSWDQSFEADNLVLNGGGQIYAIGRSTFYYNVSFPANCAVPTQAGLWYALNVNFGTCNIEIDKINDQVVLRDVVINGTLQSQSSGVKIANVTNTVIGDLQGSPLNFVGSNVTFGTMKPGAVAYGRTDSFSCSNCSVGALAIGGINDPAPNGGTGGSYTMTNGVIKIPLGASVSAVQNNGGNAQLVVNQTSPWIAGQLVNVGLSPTNYNGQYAILSIDSPTTMTINVAYASVTAQGHLCGCSIPWAAPGTTIMFSNTNGVENIGYVTGVTNDGASMYVATTFSGGFPSDLGSIRTHPAPIFNCPGCSGVDVQIGSLALCAPNTPMFSCINETYPGTIGGAFQPSFWLLGPTSLIEMNATTPSSTASQFRMFEFGGGPPYIAAATAGDRKLTASGVTCNGSAGTCDAGDNLGSLFWSGFIGSSLGSSGPGYVQAPSTNTSVTLKVTTNPTVQQHSFP